MDNIAIVTARTYEGLELAVKAKMKELKTWEIVSTQYKAVEYGHMLILTVRETVQSIERAKQLEAFKENLKKLHKDNKHAVKRDAAIKSFHKNFNKNYARLIKDVFNVLGPVRDEFGYTDCYGGFFDIDEFEKRATEEKDNPNFEANIMILLAKIEKKYKICGLRSESTLENIKEEIRRCDEKELNLPYEWYSTLGSYLQNEIPTYIKLRYEND